MATSNQVMKKMCGGNQAQTLLEKHHALRNCFERKETLFCAKEGKVWPKLSKNKKIKKVTTKEERRKKKERRKVFFFINVRYRSNWSKSDISESNWKIMKDSINRMKEIVENIFERNKTLGGQGGVARWKVFAPMEGLWKSMEG